MALRGQKRRMAPARPFAVDLNPACRQPTASHANVTPKPPRTQVNRSDRPRPGTAKHEDAHRIHHELHLYMQFADIYKKFLNSLFQRLYKVWRAMYHPVSRLVRNLTGTIKEPGALLLLSLSPPITPRCAPGSSPFSTLRPFGPPLVSTLRLRLRLSARSG